MEVETDGGRSTDLKVPDQFLFCCGVSSLMEVKSLSAPTEVEKIPVKDNEAA